MQNFKWLPRILAMAYIAFISLFALDVFRPGFSFGALLTYLLPSVLLTICLIIAWRRELVGSVLFSSFAIAYVVVIFFRFAWESFLIIGLPLFVISALFFVSALAKIKIELVEIVDESGDKTGEVMTRETAHAQGLRYKKID